MAAKVVTAKENNYDGGWRRRKRIITMAAKVWTAKRGDGNSDDSESDNCNRGATETGRQLI